MPVEALTPYIHVLELQRSLDFYRRLGLEVANLHEEGGRPVWAFVTSPADDPNHARARLMIGLGDETRAGAADPESILFYCWSPDVQRLHDELGAAGLDVGPIEHPFYMPAGEFQVVDPDGYTVVVGQLDPPVSGSA
jgi:catechol 2,3-dioxygenase-like lactoylglutathione lyase family enzyme